MDFKLITPNFYISESQSFGNYDREIISDLLKSIEINFSEALGIAPFHTCVCYIHFYPEYPAYYRVEDKHIICLCTHDNLWSQWVYQFSHEYCHLLINIDGEIKSENAGLKWFEESICELASMYHLKVLASQWSISSSDTKRLFAHCHQVYLDVLLSQNPQLLSLANHPGWLLSWESLLSEPIYHRNHYNVIAAKMLPLFLENPALWKIIFYLGNTNNWNSLECLFHHLYANAEPDYIESLQKLHDVLFS